MNEQKNGVSVLDTNQSAASWNVVNQSAGKIYVNDQFIFQDYVINTLLSMGFNRSKLIKYCLNWILKQKMKYKSLNKQLVY